MLSCRDLATRLASDYVDGQLGPVDSLRVKLHLAACENCRLQIGDLAMHYGLGVEVSSLADLVLKAMRLPGAVPQHAPAGEFAAV